MGFECERKSVDNALDTLIEQIKVSLAGQDGAPAVSKTVESWMEKQREARDEFEQSEKAMAKKEAEQRTNMLLEASCVGSTDFRVAVAALARRGGARMGKALRDIDIKRRKIFQEHDEL